MNSSAFKKQQTIRRLKVAIRRRVPPRYWSQVGGLVHAVCRGLAEIVAAVIAVPLKALPDGVLVVLHEKLVLYRPLDYDRDIITLYVTSRVERDVRLRSCQKEPETVEWIHKTMGPGDVLYDIGANVGAYSLVAASWTGGQATVYAFEPGYRTFPNLVENIFINGFEQTVIPFQIALGDRTAIVEFHYSRVDAGGARHIGIRRISGSTPVVRKQAVMTYRLDDLVPIFDLRPPTHVKIDVDGSELEVLRGARQVLASPCLQWILVEVDEAESNLQAVKALLEECGFCLEFDHYHVGSTVHNWIFRRKN